MTAILDVLKAIFSNASVLVGLIALVGLLALKKPVEAVIAGTLKTIIGFIIIGGGAGIVVNTVVPLGDLFNKVLNIPNAGLIEGLPEDAIVEVPAIINRSGIHGQPVGALPQGITALLQREVVTSQLCIDSVVKGDRTLALQSLLLDPTITGLDQAEGVLESILTSSRRFLPQFFN